MSDLTLLGIDGGGTSTVAWLADAEGNVRGCGRSGPSNSKSVGIEAARIALTEAIQAAFRDADIAPHPVDVACLGLAGFDRPNDRRLLRQWIREGRWARQEILVSDGALVIAAGTPEGWGVGLIAGTGSIAVGRWPDGRTARAGGWGYLFGDEGSAYAVAVAGLRWVAHRVDGRVSPNADDVLTGRICKALGIESPIVGVDCPEDIVSAVYAADFDRAKIAALASVVVEAAAEDPFVAEAILIPAANDLAELVSIVARRLGWHEWNYEGPLPLAVAGGFILSCPVVYEGLLSALDQMGLAVSPTRVSEPVRGAILLAQKALAS